MNPQVILLGAGGQLGRLIRAQAPTNVELHAFTSSGLDICDAEAVQGCFHLIKPHLIINAAAYTQVDKAETEQEAAFAVNAEGPRHIAEATPQKARIIHISTDFVFDGSKTTPYLPSDPTNPLGVYGHSKLKGEQHLQDLRPDTAIIRTAWLYAAEGRNFVNTMLALMESKDELSIVADQTGTPTSAHTLAEVVWRFAARGLSAGSVENADTIDSAASVQTAGIHHWTDQGQATWYEFACEIQRQALELGILKKKIPLKAITTAEYPTPAKRPAYSVLDLTSTWQTIGFKGRSWQEELQRTLQMHL